MSFLDHEDLFQQRLDRFAAIQQAYQKSEAAPPSSFPPIELITSLVPVHAAASNYFVRSGPQNRIFDPVAIAPVDNSDSFAMVAAVAISPVENFKSSQLLLRSPTLVLLAISQPRRLFLYRRPLCFLHLRFLLKAVQM